jgi:hypothetical protein
MPKEIFDKTEFITLSEQAEECRIKRLENSVKLKLRKNRYLYTIKLNTQEADELLRQLRCDTREI